MTQFLVGLAIYWAIGTAWYLIELRSKDAATRAKIAGLGPGFLALIVVVEGFVHLPYLALRVVGFGVRRWLVPGKVEPAEEAPKPDPPWDPSSAELRRRDALLYPNRRPH